MRGKQTRSAEDILREYAVEMGWDVASMLTVALEFIDGLDTDALCGGKAFRAYLRKRAAQEADMADD